MASRKTILINFVGILLYPENFPLTSQDISHIYTQGFHKGRPDKPSPKQLTQTRVLAILKSRWAPNTSSGYHASSYASNNLHVKFHALQVKFPQTIAQMVENQLYWTKSQLWSTYSQIS